MIPIGHFPNVLYALLLRVFGPSIISLANTIGFGEGLKLMEVQAALYPIWRFDAAFEGKIADESKPDQVEARGTVGIPGGFVPGEVA